LSSTENPQPGLQVDAQEDPQLQALQQLPLSMEPPAPPPIAVDPKRIGDIPSPPIPPRDPVWSGWDVLLIAGLTLVSIMVLSLILAVVAHFASPDTSLNDVAPMVAIVAQFLAYVAVAIGMVVLIEGKYHVRFWQAIRWNWPRAGWKMFSLGILLLLSITLLSRFLPMPKSTPFDQFFVRPRDAYLISLFAVTLGPLMEELFFRGLLYPVLTRRLGVGWGIVLTALPFGLMHMFQYGYAWGVVLLIFLMGVVVTVVRAVTGSVASSFLVHAGYNATEMFLLLLATDGFRHMEKAALLQF
jgi:CAAX protease family protein